MFRFAAVLSLAAAAHAQLRLPTSSFNYEVTYDNGDGMMSAPTMHEAGQVGKGARYHSTHPEAEHSYISDTVVDEQNTATEHFVVHAADTGPDQPMHEECNQFNFPHSAQEWIGFLSSYTKSCGKGVDCPPGVHADKCDCYSSIHENEGHLNIYAEAGGCCPIAAMDGPSEHQFDDDWAPPPQEPVVFFIHSWKVDEEIDDHVFMAPCQPAAKKGLRGSQKKSLRKSAKKARAALNKLHPFRKN